MVRENSKAILGSHVPRLAFLPCKERVESSILFGSTMLKRYQYWSKDGIIWTNWFKWDGEKLPSPFKKLKVEYKDE